MRKVRKGDKGAGRLASVAKLLVVAVCFIAVFSIALAFGDGMFGAVLPDVSIENNVAEAKDGGTTTTINPDKAYNVSNFIYFNNSDMSGSSYLPSTSKAGDGFEPMNMNGSVVYRYPMTFNNTSLSTSNATYYTSASNTPTISGWTLTLPEDTHNDRFASFSVNCAIPTEIINLIKEAPASVASMSVIMSATVTGDYGGSSSGAVWGNKDGQISIAVTANTEQKNAKQYGTGNDPSLPGHAAKSGIFHDTANNTYNLTSNYGLTLGTEYNFLHLGFIYNFGKYNLDPKGPRRMAISNLEVSFRIVISENSFNNSTPTASIEENNFAPVIKSDAKPSAYPFYPGGSTVYGFIQHDDISNATKSGSTVNLISYTHTTLGKFNSRDYYKKAAFTFTEPGDKNALKKFSIGNEEGAAFDILRFIATNVTSETKSILDSAGESVGFAQLTKNSVRSIKVELYFFKNTSVELICDNFGKNNNQFKLTLNVQGIDNKTPTNSLTLEKNGTSEWRKIQSDVSGLANAQWWTSAVFDPTTIIEQESTEEYFSPTVWYYYVQKFNSIDDITNSKAKTYAEMRTLCGKDPKIHPFTMGLKANNGSALQSFAYSFYEGKAYGITTSGSDNITASGGYTAAGNENVESVKGNGYYRFDFYVFDLAGNEGEIKTYYLKVDYSDFGHTFEYSYDDVTNKNTTTKMSADDAANGKWATGTVTMTFKLKINTFAGNTLYFTIGDVFYALQFDGSGELTAITGPGNNLSTTTTTTGTITTAIVTMADETMSGDKTLQFAYKNEVVDNMRTLTLTFPDQKDHAIAFTTSFVWLKGITTEDIKDNFDAYDIEVAKYEVEGSTEDTFWGSYNGKKNVHFYMDSIKPVIPTIESAGDAPLQSDETTGKATSKYEMLWYTAGLDVGTIVTFDDDVARQDNAFQKGVSVYYAFITIDNPNELTELLGWISDYPDFYKSVSSDNLKLPDCKAGNLTKAEKYDGSNFALGQYTTTINMMEFVGMRVLFTWAVDQAGLYSDDFHSYILLVDKTDYSVTATLKNQSNLSDGRASITVEAESGTLKRGQSVSLKMNVAQHYIPFTFELDGNVMYHNYTSDYVWYDAAGEEATALAFSDGSGDEYKVCQYTTTLDNPNNFTKMQETVTYTLAVRRMVYRLGAYNENNGYSLASDSAPYNKGKAIKPEISYNPLSPNSGEVAPATNSIAAEYYTQDGEKIDSIIDAGLYKVLLFVPNFAKDFDQTRIYIDEEGKNRTGTDAILNFISVTKFNEDGERVFEDEDYFPYTVTPLTVSIYRVATESTYGEYVHNKLAFSFKDPALGDEANDSEFNDKIREEEGITITLSINATGISWDDIKNGNALLPVGSYQTTATFTFAKAQNYVITLVGDASHTVGKRTVEVHTIHSSKTYGDEIETYKFGIDKSYFNWTDSPVSAEYKDIAALIEDMFGGQYKYELAGDTYVFELTGSADSAIRRNGYAASSARLADAGDYAYSSTAHFTAVNNYTFKLTVSENDNGKFTIEKRNVTIRINAEYAEAYAAEPSITPEAKNKYIQWLYGEGSTAISTNTGIPELDEIIKSYNTNGIFGHLELGEADKLEDPGDYSAVFTMSVTFLGAKEYTTSNFVFTIGDEYFVVLFAQGDSLIVTLLRPIDFVYGDMWNASEFTFERYRDYFKVERADGAEAPAYDTITWTATIADILDGSYPSAGTYAISFSNAKAMKDGAVVQVGEKDCVVNVPGISVTFAKAAIKVKAVVQNKHKTYGEPDSAFGISYAIYKIGNTEFPEGFKEGDTYAGLDFATISDYVSGSFIRAVYNKSTNTYVRNGQQYDDSSFESGVVKAVSEGAIVEGDTYYRLRANAFTLSSDGNANFSLSNESDVTTDTELRFVIDPVKVTLDAKNFKAIGKMYNNSNEVDLSGILVYDFASAGVMKLPTDSITLLFEAIYVDSRNVKEPTDGKGVPYDPTEVGVKFTKLRLTGASMHNYELAKVTNDRTGVAEEAELFENEEDHTNKDSVAYSEDIILIIYMYAGEDGERHAITIDPITIALQQSDFSITKVYDSTRDLKISDISFTQRREDAASSNTVLFDEFNKEEGRRVYLLSGDSELPFDGVLTGGYPSANATSAGSRYLLSFTLRFYVDYADRFKTQSTNSIRFEGVENDGDPYLDVSFVNIAATITRFELQEENFTSFDAVDRDYNGNAEVDINFEMKNLPVNDSKERVNAHVTGNAVNEEGTPSKDAGEWGVSLTDVTIGNVTNYSLSDEQKQAIINKYVYNSEVAEDRIDVIISKARLVLSGTFEDKMYDGLDALYDSENGVDLIIWQGGKVGISTVNFAEELSSELSNFAVTLKAVRLSDKGKANANVTFEGEEVIPHNVMIQGLTVTDTSKSDLLKNYTFEGKIFDEESGSYRAITDEDVTKGDNSYTIDAYELVAEKTDDGWSGPITVSKRTFNLFENRITIPDKVYDGTTSANVFIEIPENADGMFFVADCDREYLAVEAAAVFTTQNVGTNVPISFTEAPRLVIASGLDAEALAYVLKNYELLPYSGKNTGNILYRPIELTATVGDKTYDGTTVVDAQNVSHSFNSAHFVVGEETRYSASQTAAYYVDKNVAFDAEDNVIAKKVTIIDPVLRSSDGYVNYVPVMKASKRDGETPAMFEIISGGEVILRDYYRLPTEEEISGNEVVYYYKFLLTDKYVASLTAANADKVICSYDLGGEQVYLVPSDYVADGSETVSTLSAAVRYMQIEDAGKILQKAVSLDASKLSILDANVFHKEYDGTTKFYGIRKRAYRFDDDAIKGLVKEDIGLVEIKDVAAEFDKAGTDATVVNFNIAELQATAAATESGYGMIYKNYTVTPIDSTFSATQPASIRKTDLTAILADSTMEYGANIDANGRIGEGYYSISYAFRGSEVTLSEMSFYMSYDAFVKAMKLDEIEERYLEQLTSLRCKKDGESFVQDEGGDYIRLDGTLTELPYAVAKFASSRPNAFDTATSFTVAGGEAQYFNFVGQYTGANTSTLTITQKHVFAAVDVTSPVYAAVYGANWQNTYSYSLVLYEGDGRFGVASWDSFSDIFIINNRSYAPLIEWWLVRDEGSGYEYVEKMGRYPKLTADLGENEAYVARLVLPDGWDEVYKKGNTIYNYYFHVPEAENNLDSGVQYNEEKSVFELIYHCDVSEADYPVQTSTLDLTLPAAESLGISLPNTEYSFEYNGKSQLESVVMGTIEGDNVFIKEVRNGEETGRSLEVVNAGTYVGRVHVIRKIMIDAEDPNEYTVEWMGNVDSVTVIITPADIGLKAAAMSNSYGAVHGYDLHNNLSYRTDIPELEDIYKNIDKVFTVTYGKYVDGEFVAMTKDEFDAADAGNYAVIIRLNEKFEEDIDHGNHNFVIYEQDGSTYYGVVAEYTVSKAVVKVTIESVAGLKEDDGAVGNVKRFVGTYHEGTEYTVSFTYGIPDKTLARILPPESYFTQEFLRDGVNEATDINAPGRYQFRIVMLPEYANNYALSGNDGILELYASQLSITKEENVSQNGDVGIGASVEILDNVNVIANRIVVHKVAAEGTTNDNVLYSAINSYMPKISPYASIASVLQVSLYYDNSPVKAQNVRMQLSVELPAEVNENMDGVVVYAETAEGQLVKIDYEIVDKHIVYEANYLGALVFVDVNPPALPDWAFYLIVAGGSLVGLFFLVLVISFIVRKAKLKKIKI